MKWIKYWERKWFPNESTFQRIRRRRIIFFSTIGVIVLVVGVVKAVTIISMAEGKPPPQKREKISGRSW